MRTILATALAASLASCATAPGAPAEGPYRAIGTEPFWDLDIGSELRFTDRGTGFTIAEPAPRPVETGAGKTYSGRRLNVTIVDSPCSDGMSERVYPDSVSLTVDGRPYRGCGAPRAFFSRTGEDGLPS